MGARAAGEVVTLTFPIGERTDDVTIEKHRYRLVRRGNDVVWIDPPGESCPLYQRGYYRTRTTLWKQTTRFAPAVEID